MNAASLYTNAALVVSASISGTRTSDNEPFRGISVSTLNTDEIVHVMREVIRRDFDHMSKRLNEMIVGNWVLWIGRDGKEYYNWNDLPDDELLKARLTGKCTANDYLNIS
jgi:hypothetical protein